MIEFLYPPLARKKKVGARIALLRNAMGHTQKHFAERLGITPNRLSMWETGERSPNFEELAKIAEITNATMDYLLLGRSATLSEILIDRIEALDRSTDLPER